MRSLHMHFLVSVHSASISLNSIYGQLVIPVVPHKAVVEISRIGNIYERLVAGNDGWQSEPIHGQTGGLSVLQSSVHFLLSVRVSGSFSIYLSAPHLIDLICDLSISIPHRISGEML